MEISRSGATASRVTGDNFHHSQHVIGLTVARDKSRVPTPSFAKASHTCVG
jgi:hypothetical protein